MTAFALLAFFLQSLAVQTHIHAPLQTAGGQAVAAPGRAGQAPLKTQDPIDQCRLCQELVHAGIFVAPVCRLRRSPDLTFAAAVSPPCPAFTPSSATAFAWQSRAPPRR